MDPNAIAAIAAASAAWVAVFISLLSAKHSKRTADAAMKQTEIQLEIAKQSGQPYVWADIQSNEDEGYMLHLVVGNSGPTLAQNIRVNIDPPIRGVVGYEEQAEVAQRRLKEGIRSLSPGRTLKWSLGPGNEYVQDEAANNSYNIHVTADGPWGPIEPLEFQVAVNDMRETLDMPVGSMHRIRKAIDKLEKTIREKKC